MTESNLHTQMDLTEIDTLDNITLGGHAAEHMSVPHRHKKRPQPAQSNQRQRGLPHSRIYIILPVQEQE